MAGESAREQARRSREKAERLLQRADRYERGAVGEELTAGALKALPPEWTVLHDVRWPGRRLANIDHVVIGPPGIFVLDSKNWSGRLSLTGGVLRQNGHSREATTAACADAALALSELVAGYAGYVVPVLCFVRDERVAGWARDVVVCSTANLVEMLTTRPVRLTSDQVRTVSWQVDALLREAGTAAAARQGPRRRRLPSRPAGQWSRGTTPRRSRSRRKGSSPLGPIVGLLMVLAVLAGGPRLATAFGNAFVHAVTVDVRSPAACPTSPQSSVRRSTVHRRRARHAAKRAHPQPTAVASTSGC